MSCGVRGNDPSQRDGNTNSPVLGTVISESDQTTVRGTITGLPGFPSLPASGPDVFGKVSDLSASTGNTIGIVDASTNPARALALLGGAGVRAEKRGPPATPARAGRRF